MLLLLLLLLLLWLISPYFVTAPLIIPLCGMQPRSFDGYTAVSPFRSSRRSLSIPIHVRVHIHLSTPIPIYTGVQLIGSCGCYRCYRYRAQDDRVAIGRYIALCKLHLHFISLKAR